MTGLLLLFVVAIWAFAAYSITRLIALKVPQGHLRVPACIGVFVVLFALPLFDEIVGMFQFQHLCRQNAGIHVDRAKATGKTVHVANVPNEEVKGTWVRIVLQPIRFRDTSTGESVISYNRLTAYGGWLIHTLGISEYNAPLLFRGSCVPGDQFTFDRLSKELNITLVRK